MMSKKKIIVAMSMGSMFLFLGCSGKEPSKEEVKVEHREVKELSVNEKKYALVVKKTVDDCKEHQIMLDEKRITAFVNKFPQSDIDKIVTIETKLPKANCQFFADETSVEKEEKVKEIVAKTLSACSEFGVNLNEKFLFKKASSIPLFVIKKVLAATNKTTENECKGMKAKEQ
jgi:hypothetical protein